MTFFTVGREESSLQEQIGYAVQCMLHNKNYSLFPVLSLQHWTENAILHKQIKFIFDAQGKPLAYFTWACLRQDTTTRLMHDPHFRLHPSEWNEGGDVWMLDFCCKPGYAKAILRFIKPDLPWKNDEIYWYSRRKKIVRARRKNALS